MLYLRGSPLPPSANPAELTLWEGSARGRQVLLSEDSLEQSDDGVSCLHGREGVPRPRWCSSRGQRGGVKALVVKGFISRRFGYPRSDFSDPIFRFLSRAYYIVSSRVRPVREKCQCE